MIREFSDGRPDMPKTFVKSGFEHDTFAGLRIFYHGVRSFFKQDVTLFSIRSTTECPGAAFTNFFPVILSYNSM